MNRILGRSVVLAVVALAGSLSACTANYDASAESGEETAFSQDEVRASVRGALIGKYSNEGDSLDLRENGTYAYYGVRAPGASRRVREEGRFTVHTSRGTTTVELRARSVSRSFRAERAMDTPYYGLFGAKGYDGLLQRVELTDPSFDRCAAVRCMGGTHCVSKGEVITCVADAPSCDNHVCETSTHCELREVQCITAPCYPAPTCVVDLHRDPCHSFACPTGKHCTAPADAPYCVND